MLKLYQRIEKNTIQHFNDILPATGADWRTRKKRLIEEMDRKMIDLVHQQSASMANACDLLLKPVFSQLECLTIDQKFEVYEHILNAFVQAWLTILRQRKYRFRFDFIWIYLKLSLDFLVRK